MRKRLRKKLRTGEFRENVFAAEYSLHSEFATDSAAEEFLWRFLEQAIEANGLSCGGGGQGEGWEFLVSVAKRGSPTDGQRASVGDWLARQPEVERYAVGEFFDGWHGVERTPYETDGAQVGA